MSSYHIVKTFLDNNGIKSYSPKHNTIFIDGSIDDLEKIKIKLENQFRDMDCRINDISGPFLVLEMKKGKNRC